MLYIEVLISVLFFLNKLLLLLKYRSGWFIGAITSLIAIGYFYHIHFYIYTALQIGLFTLMMYRFFPRRSKKFEWLVRISITLSMIALGYYFFSGVVTILEFISSILLLLGAYLLANKKLTFGWGVWVIAHIIVAIVCFIATKNVFATFQVLSAIIALIGLGKTFTTAK